MAITNLQVLQGLGQLPALTLIESQVALAWLSEHYQEYEWVDFNVRLGDGIELPAGTPAEIKQWARMSTTKRADMILGAGRDVTIVEVKIRAGGSAVGQLLLYQALWLAAHPETERVFLVVAAQTIEPDVRSFYGQHHITVELFPLAGTVATKS